MDNSRSGNGATSRALVLAACVTFAPSLALAENFQLMRFPSLNIDPAQVSVSGISSGGGMAIQIGVAYSSRIMGVAAFAASPYDCYRPGGVTPGRCEGFQPPDISPVLDNSRRWFGREIDAQEHLARQRVFLYVGAYDTVISPVVVRQTKAFYDAFVPAANIRLVDTVQHGHNIATDYFNPAEFSPQCHVPQTRLVDCGYDSAGAALEWIYGPLAPRSTALQPGGDLLALDQREFISRQKGMDDLAFLYLPKACAAGDTVCRLHVFLHGCGASFESIRRSLYADWSGHSRWAETNRIVLLFPQTYPDPEHNPTGCWDEKGLYDSQYDQKGGTQVEAIMAMVTRLTSGYQPVAATAVEYYHREYDHYFVTSGADEIGKLDDGTFAGWARTGETFAVYPLDTPGTRNVCRFFTVAFPPSSSHFYTASASECALRRQGGDWQFEGERFAVAEPDTGGACAAGTRPVHRLYNNGQGGAPNHRYVNSTSASNAMVAKGWIAEGVFGCVPQ